MTSASRGGSERWACGKPDQSRGPSSNNSDVRRDCSRTTAGDLVQPRLKLTGRGDKSFYVLWFLREVSWPLIVEQERGPTAAGLNRNSILNSYRSVFIQGVLQLLTVSWFKSYIERTFTLSRWKNPSFIPVVFHTDTQWNTKLSEGQSCRLPPRCWISAGRILAVPINQLIFALLPTLWQAALHVSRNLLKISSFWYFD